MECLRGVCCCLFDNKNKSSTKTNNVVETQQLKATKINQRVVSDTKVMNIKDMKQPVISISNKHSPMKIDNTELTLNNSMFPKFSYRVECTIPLDKVGILQFPEGWESKPIKLFVLFQSSWEDVYSKVNNLFIESEVGIKSVLNDSFKHNYKDTTLTMFIKSGLVILHQLEKVKLERLNLDREKLCIYNFVTLFIMACDYVFEEITVQEESLSDQTQLQTLNIELLKSIGNFESFTAIKEELSFDNLTKWRYFDFESNFQLLKEKFERLY